jgi:TPR repeat protein
MMRKLLTICCTVAVLLLLEGCQRANQWLKDEIAPSADDLRRLAERGDSAAQFNEGLTNEFAWGVRRDHAKAVRWYRKAAEQGHARAQSKLGNMYANGWGVAKDDAEAVK